MDKFNTYVRLQERLGIFEKISNKTKRTHISSIDKRIEEIEKKTDDLIELWQIEDSNIDNDAKDRTIEKGEIIVSKLLGLEEYLDKTADEARIVKKKEELLIGLINNINSDMPAEKEKLDIIYTEQAKSYMRSIESFLMFAYRTNRSLVNLMGEFCCLGSYEPVYGSFFLAESRKRMNKKKSRIDEFLRESVNRPEEVFIELFNKYWGKIWGYVHSEEEWGTLKRGNNSGLYVSFNFNLGENENKEQHGFIVDVKSRFVDCILNYLIDKTFAGLGILGEKETKTAEAFSRKERTKSEEKTVNISNIRDNVIDFTKYRKKKLIS